MLQRRVRLAAYRSGLARVREALAKTVAQGAETALVISGEPKLIEELARYLPNLYASVSSLGVRSGNLAWALAPLQKFDLCLWELDAGELVTWQDDINAIGFCLKPGATIIGFCAHHCGLELPLSQNDRSLNAHLDRPSPMVAFIDRGRRALESHGFGKAMVLTIQRRIRFKAITPPQGGAILSRTTQATDRRPTVVTIVARAPSELPVLATDEDSVSTGVITELGQDNVQLNPRVHAGL